MIRKILLAGVLGLSCMGLALAGRPNPGPAWMKLDEARALSLSTGNPILVYSTVDPTGGGS